MGDVIEAYLKDVASDVDDTVVCDEYFMEYLESRKETTLRRKPDASQWESQRLLLVPVHLPGHWTLLAVDLSSHTIQYWDSLGGDPNEAKKMMRQLETFLTASY